MWTRSFVARALVGIVVLAAAFVFVYADGDIRGAWSTALGRKPVRYVPAHTDATGTELLFVYIGSDGCHWSNIAELPGIIERLKLKVHAESQSLGLAFTALGVAADSDTKAGLRHLQKFGAFDEVMSGNGWMNTGVLKFIHNGTPGRSATPQIVITTRSVELNDTVRDVGEDRLVLRKVGIQEIQAWLDAGAKIPRTFSK
jgi:hypothetical protein